MSEREIQGWNKKKKEGKNFSEHWREKTSKKTIFEWENIMDAILLKIEISLPTNLIASQIFRL